MECGGWRPFVTLPGSAGQPSGTEGVTPTRLLASRGHGTPTNAIARSSCSIGGQRRGADDAGGVLEGGGDDGGLELEQREELVRLAAHAAADDEEVGGEEDLEERVVRLETLGGPLLVRQAFTVLRRRRRARLGVVAVELQVAELGVGNQHAVVQERDPDARAQGRQDDETVLAFRRPVPELGDARGVGEG